MVATVEQLCDYTKNTKLYSLSGWIVWYANNVSTQLACTCSESARGGGGEVNTLPAQPQHRVTSPGRSAQRHRGLDEHIIYSLLYCLLCTHNGPQVREKNHEDHMLKGAQKWTPRHLCLKIQG